MRARTAAWLSPVHRALGTTMIRSRRAPVPSDPRADLVDNLSHSSVIIQVQGTPVYRTFPGDGPGLVGCVYVEGFHTECLPGQGPARECQSRSLFCNRRPEPIFTCRSKVRRA